MTIFCHFRTLNYHKKHYKPILLAQEVSADPQGPRTTKNKIYFLRGSEPLCPAEPGKSVLEKVVFSYFEIEKPVVIAYIFLYRNRKKF